MKLITSEIIRTTTRRDLKRRRYHKASDREARFAEYDKSYLTQRVFSKREGIRFNTFTTCLMQRRYKLQTTTNFAEITLPMVRLIKVVN
jgi:hypothetical protein